MNPGGQLLRALTLQALIGLALVFALAYAQYTTRFDAPGGWRVLLYLGMAVTGLAAVFCWPTLRRKVEIALILLVAVLLRLALLPAAPSDDIHRYLWEGKLVAAGVSPYQAVADDAVFAEHRDAQWAQMNHRDKWTAYPPGAMLTFALLGKVSYSPIFFKATFALLDVAVVALLLAVLARRSLPLRWAGLYAFNPLILVSFAGEGHFDVLMVAALVGAIWASDAKRPWMAAVLLGVAVAMKIIAVLALPFLLKRLGWRVGFAFVVAVFALSIPFLGDLDSMLRGLFLFGSERSFNGLPYDLWLRLFDSRMIANVITATLFLGLAAWRLFGRVRGRWEDDWLFICGALLVLSPTMHFWYLTWILPLIALRPSVAWLTFSVTLGFYFLVWSNAAAGDWTLTWPQMALIWLPFLLIGFYEWTHFHRRRIAPTGEWPDGLSVIIPTLNAGSHLPDCLASLRQSSVQPSELIVADGGSTDETPALAAEADCAFIPAPKGRGEQIAAGLAAARFRYVLILHADCQLAPNSLARLRNAFQESPGLVGGSLGQRFNRPRPMLLLIEALNEIRATLGSVSFGDQAQFFDRRYLPDADFPAQPLMEDVELSLRLRERGRCVYLGSELTSESAKWQGIGSWRRVVLVFRFVAKYRWARMRSRPRAFDLSRQLYREYYEN